MTKNSIFFNHSFEKKRLKTLISWIHKTFGEKEALRVVDELKVTGFNNATLAGLSIGLHDLITPPEKPLLISKAQVAMNKTDQDFKGGKITATERSQRIIDTWHRTSDTLRKQVVDHFNTYDQLNSVYIMALSGARGNFSQVRQLIGMRGLMADPQGQIISFPIRSNFREGLTLTEYFISCSGARKGLVDTALRTADTGYLTRRLVDVSHQVVIKRVACNTSRGIVLKALKTGPVGGSNKTMLALQDRLIGRVLAEDIKVLAPFGGVLGKAEQRNSVPADVFECNEPEHTLVLRTQWREAHNRVLRDRAGGRPTTADAVRPLQGRARQSRAAEPACAKPSVWRARQRRATGAVCSDNSGEIAKAPVTDAHSYKVATRDSEISPNLAFKIACLRDQVIVRSSLTCACTHEVCQLCYGWSLSQGKLVSLGEAVGVIAAQSIGEPGTQLTMRTFHTGGVFSGDLLQDIRTPHAGKVFFPQALQGLLVRTAQGHIAFLIKVPGVLLLDDGDSKVTRIQLQAATMVFVRQGEFIESNTIIGELAVMTKEGNQPIKSRQTLFAEFGGRVTHQRGRTLKVHKPETDDEPLSAIIQWYEEEELDIVRDAEEGIDRLKNGFRFIEPTHSVSLGVFRILATRVGAKATHLPNFYLSEPNFRFSESYYQLAVPTCAKPKVWHACLAPFGGVLGKAEQRNFVPATLVSKARRAQWRKAPTGPTGLFAQAREPVVESNRANLADGVVQFVRPVWDKDSAASCRPTTTGKIMQNQMVLHRPTLFDKNKNNASGRRYASAMSTFRTPCYVLNTIAEQGDLVDENYKSCTSERLLTFGEHALSKVSVH